MIQSPGTSTVAEVTLDQVALGQADLDQADLDQAALDQAALDNLRAIGRPGMPSVLGRVIETYLRLAPTLLQQLRDAILVQPDPDALRHAAHSLKSSSANLGALSLAALCRDLEFLGRDGTTAGADALLARIEVLFPRVCEQLARELDKLAA